MFYRQKLIVHNHQAKIQPETSAWLVDSEVVRQTFPRQFYQGFFLLPLMLFHYLGYQSPWLLFNTVCQRKSNGSTPLFMIENYARNFSNNLSLSNHGIEAKI